jgi:hypothetical protein
MSFSAMMDEMNPPSDFDYPTRPVTPVHDDDDTLSVPTTNQHLKNDNNYASNDAANAGEGDGGKRLYHSESVTRALNQLSRDLSGMAENTIFSSKADRMPPPIGVGYGEININNQQKSEHEFVDMDLFSFFSSFLGTSSSSSDFLSVPGSAAMDMSALETLATTSVSLTLSKSQYHNLALGNVTAPTLVCTLSSPLTRLHMLIET